MQKRKFFVFNSIKNCTLLRVGISALPSLTPFLLTLKKTSIPMVYNFLGNLKTFFLVNATKSKSRIFVCFFPPAPVDTYACALKKGGCAVFEENKRQIYDPGVVVNKE